MNEFDLPKKKVEGVEWRDLEFRVVESWRRVVDMEDGGRRRASGME